MNTMIQQTTGEDRVAFALVSMATSAIWRQRLDEAEILCAAARRLSPHWVHAQSLELMIQVQSGRHVDALTAIAGRDDSAGLAVRACCMQRMGDASWESIAREILQRDDSATSSELMRFMLTREGLEAPERTSATERSAQDSGLSAALLQRGMRV